MAEIIPAVLAPNWSEIEDKLKQIEGLATWAHIDVADGLFVKALTWNEPSDLELLDGQTKIEVHLMLENPEEVVAMWLPVADRLIVHLEATERLDDLVEAFQSTNTKLGLALLPETPIEDVLPYAEKVAIIQLMGIKNVGYQGQIFDRETIKRIADLRDKLPTVNIQVDGGINLETGRECLAAGATSLVVGSTLWQSADVVTMVKQFKAL